MDQTLINAVFQPKPSKQEAKADATTRLVQAIIDNEASAREAKTERLRVARLAQEAAAKPAPETGKKVLRKR
ncbi:MAG: hypothetical protein WBA88_22025 [Pseudaminobacter sp.]